MKENGISSVVVLVVVVVVILIGVGYFFLIQSPKERLPVYPGATPSEVPELWSELFATFESHGISASMYTTEANSDEVLDWYRSEMSERGWSKILDNTFDNSHVLSFLKGNEGAGVIENKGAMILIHGTVEQFQAVMEEWSQELQPSPYPALAASPVVSNGTIRINVQIGSIPSGDWDYSVSPTEGSYSWTTGTEELDSPYVTLETFAQGTYYVSLRHKSSGHIYFADTLVTISGPAPEPGVPYFEVVTSVTWVVDGDTIDVLVENIVVDLDPAGDVDEDTVERVRFGAGIDAPEWYMEGGSEATEFIENLIPVGTTVYLDLNDLSLGGRTGRPYRGTYERLIAVIYVELDGQWVNVNAELLLWGQEAYPYHNWLKYIYFPSEWDPYEWLEDDYPYVRD